MILRDGLMEKGMLVGMEGREMDWWKRGVLIRKRVERKWVMRVIRIYYIYMYEIVRKIIE